MGPWKDGRMLGKGLLKEIQMAVKKSHQKPLMGWWRDLRIPFWMANEREPATERQMQQTRGVVSPETGRRSNSPMEPSREPAMVLNAHQRRQRMKMLLLGLWSLTLLVPSSLPRFH